MIVSVQTLIVTEHHNVKNVEPNINIWLKFLQKSSWAILS